MSNATDRQLAEAQCNGYDAPHMGRMADEDTFDSDYVRHPRLYAWLGLVLTLATFGIVAVALYSVPWRTVAAIVWGAL